MNRFTRDYYAAELNDVAMAFGTQTTYIARFCMAAALYFEVAWTRERDGCSRSSTAP